MSCALAQGVRGFLDGQGGEGTVGQMERKEKVIVTLGYDEIQFCQLMGRMRQLVNMNAGTVDRQVGKNDPAEINVIGFAAEYAFAKKFNTFPDLTMKARSGSPDGIINGVRYDVKATINEGYDLLCTLKENTEVDIYIHAYVCFPRIEFEGFAFSHELRREENIKDWGHGPTYSLSTKVIRKMEDVLTLSGSTLPTIGEQLLEAPNHRETRRAASHQPRGSHLPWISS